VNQDQFVPTHITSLKHDLNLQLPLDDASADAVLALEIMEHLENPKFFLREISRVLRPGGTLVLSTPNIVNLRSRFRFLFRSEFHLFYNERRRTADGMCEEASGHITPLLPWLLEIFLQEAGIVPLETHYTRTERIPVRSKLFSDNIIIKAGRAAAQ
jgi:2-polyprenyl-3-methyl-5-hydroxy-6-metoxy-1,4-benzoquinol methylase